MTPQPSNRRIEPQHGPAAAPELEYHEKQPPPLPAPVNQPILPPTGWRSKQMQMPPYRGPMMDLDTIWPPPCCAGSSRFLPVQLCPSLAPATPAHHGFPAEARAACHGAEPKNSAPHGFEPLSRKNFGAPANGLNSSSQGPPDQEWRSRCRMIGDDLEGSRSAKAALPPARAAKLPDRQESLRIDTAEVSRRTGLSRRTVTAHAARGWIPGARQFGRKWTFDSAVIDAWINGEFEWAKTETSTSAAISTTSGSRSADETSVKAFRRLLGKPHGASGTSVSGNSRARLQAAA